jgi:hypothetical protein
VGDIDELVALGARVGDMLLLLVVLLLVVLLVVVLLVVVMLLVVLLLVVLVLLLVLLVLVLLLVVANMVGLMDGSTVMFELLKVLVDTRDALALLLVGTNVEPVLRSVGATVGPLEPPIVIIVGNVVFLFKPVGRGDDFKGALVVELGALVTPPGTVVGFEPVVGVDISPVPLTDAVGAGVTPPESAKTAFAINMARKIERSMLR